MFESIPLELFTRDCCGNPCRFGLYIHSKELESKVKSTIQAGGGVTENYQKPDKCDCRLIFADFCGEFLSFAIRRCIQELL